MNTRDEAAGALLTDFYQLTMLQAYVTSGMQDTAVFEFFVRKLPECRNFMIAAGLEQVLSWLESLRFSDAELAWVAGQGTFTPAFVEYLRGFRFAGDVHAMPEGTVFFPDEPILRVTARLPEAQFVESRLINLLHFQTLIASKAVRAVLAAPGKRLVDFGLRRAHGAEAALYAARASYLAGFTGTATVQAGVRFGIPVFGTMAHSFVQAHDGEPQAFEAFALACPRNVVLLIDTYDTEAAAREVVRLTPRLKSAGIAVQGVRIDSGDLGAHARQVRRILDEGGARDVTIFASGNVDEYLIDRLHREGCPVDAFGVGTHMDTSSDAPALDCAYKLQEYAGTARRKRSEGKATWPGRKQVHRRADAAGHFAGDTVTVEGDGADGEALLRTVMRAGWRLAPPEPLATVRARVVEQLRGLPPALRALTPAPAYPVTISESLRELARTVDARTAVREPAPAPARRSASL